MKITRIWPVNVRDNIIPDDMSEWETYSFDGVAGLLRRWACSVDEIRLLKADDHMWDDYTYKLLVLAGVPGVLTRCVVRADFALDPLGWIEGGD